MSTSAGTRTLKLAPVDAIPYPLQWTYLFDTSLDVARLRASLDAILPQFWPLLGVLHPVQLRVDVSPDALVDWVESDDLEVTRAQLLSDLLVAKRISGTLSPTAGFAGGRVSAFTVVRIADGIVLNVSISHAVSDEVSFFDLFLASWAEHYNGLPTSITPVHDRSLLTAVPTAPVAKKQPEAVMMVPCGAIKAPEAPPAENAETSPDNVESPPHGSREFSNACVVFTQEEVLNLKKCHNVNSRQQGLIAALWKVLGQENLAIPANLRGNESRWAPELPHCYYGNGVFHGFCPAGKSVAEGIPNAELSRAQHEWLWENVKDLSNAVVSNMAPTNLLVSSWAHMSICPKFGNSKPVLCMLVPYWPANLIVVTNSQTEGGVFDVYCSRELLSLVNSLKL